MESSVAETYHTQDEEVRAYLEHILAKEVLEAAERVIVESPDVITVEPIFGD